MASNYKFINWSEVSIFLSQSEDRSRIRSNYRGKKYAVYVNMLKLAVNAWERWASKKMRNNNTKT